MNKHTNRELEKWKYWQKDKHTEKPTTKHTDNRRNRSKHASRLLQKHTDTMTKQHLDKQKDRQMDIQIELWTHRQEDVETNGWKYGHTTGLFNPRVQEIWISNMNFKISQFSLKKILWRSNHSYLQYSFKMVFNCEILLLCYVTTHFTGVCRKPGKLKSPAQTAKQQTVRQ